jgi:electron transfer flavoprotein alpha/beta subunit
MRIIVFLHAPPPDPEIGTTLGRDDRFALAYALTLGAAPVEAGDAHRVTALLAGSPAEAGPLQRAVAAGVDRAVRLAGDDYRTADFHTMGQALAAGVRRVGGADLVLAGARSDDEGLGAVPASVARQLGFTYVANVEAIAHGPAKLGALKSEAGADGTVEVLVRGGGRKRRLRVKLPAVLAVTAGPPTATAPSDRTSNPNDVEVISLTDPEATVVRRRTELAGRAEPASRGTEEVANAADFIAALVRR